MSDDRIEIMALIKEARHSGARQSRACEIMGLSPKTIQRWSQSQSHQDGRIEAKQSPSNKLTELEYQRIIKVANQPEYADLSPGKIVPKLADNGVYIASESTFYRVLCAEKQLKHRQKAKPIRQIKKPKALCATAPNQLYSWDITYLPTQVKGIFLYLYLVMDIFSRKIVGWQVYQNESSAQAADLMTDICLREKIERHQVTLHSDNGSPMKGATMLTTLQQLGVVPSFSRPSVSNDNPYSESLFRTLKYRPEYPEEPFSNLYNARNWVQGFVDWYNEEHLHSEIKFVTPGQRHRGEDVEILAHRKVIYQAAKLRNPSRWSGDIRNWEPIKEVYLNPEKQKVDEKENKAA
jgi:transposase InsO family protein